jgi:hypothetical protein
VPREVLERRPATHRQESVHSSLQLSVITAELQFLTRGFYNFPDNTCFSFRPSQSPIRTILKLPDFMSAQS